MKKLLSLLLSLAALSPALSQTVTAPASLPAASALGSGDTVVVVQGGILVGATTAQARTSAQSGLATVALSGAYGDLSGKPTLGTLAPITPSGTATTSTFLRGDNVWAPPVIFATAAGTNVYTAAPTPALSGYSAGLSVVIVFTNANTGAASLNLNSIGAIPIEQNGVAIVAGQIPAGSTVALTYDGANFQIVGTTSGSYIFSTGLVTSGSTITVAYGTSAGTALQGNAIGSTVQAYNAKLTTLSGSLPFTAGSNVTITGTWPAITISAAGFSLPYTVTNFDDGITLFNNYEGNPIILDDVNGNPSMQGYSSYGTVAGDVLGFSLGGILTLNNNPTNSAGGLVKTDGSNFLPSGMLGNDIGVTVEGYDATILKAAAIGVTVEGYDATILNAANIGVTVLAPNGDASALTVGGLQIVTPSSTTAGNAAAADSVTNATNATNATTLTGAPSANLTAQTGGPNVLDYVPGASLGTYLISAYVTVTTSASPSVQAYVQYTDENGNPHIQFIGAPVTGLPGTGSLLPSVTIRATNATDIVVGTSNGVDGSVYDVGATIVQLN